MTKLIAFASLFGLTFVFVTVAAGVAWMWVGKKRRVSASPEILQVDQLSALDSLAVILAKAEFTAKIQRLIDEADSPWTVGRAILMMAMASLLTLVGMSSLDLLPIFAIIPLAAVIGFVPIFWLNHLRGKRMAAVEEQLPEALDYISRALVAGHSLPLALELLADEIDEPLAPELRKTVDEYNLGTTMEGALAKLADRVPCADIRFFVSAIMTQQRTGGSLHELLENLADTIRERSTIKGQIRALTANGRITAIVLSLLPVFIGVAMLIVSPEYFMVMAGNEVGKSLLIAGACTEVIAFFVIRKIADIQV